MLFQIFLDVHMWFQQESMAKLLLNGMLPPLPCPIELAHILWLDGGLGICPAARQKEQLSS